MKAKYPVAIACLMVWLVSFAHAGGGTPKEIELTDGSVIQAEVLSFSNGIYRLKSNTLGVFSIDEKKIRSIRFKQSGSANSPPRGASSRNVPGGNFSATGGQPVQQQVREMTDRLMQDPDALRLIQSLSNDPSVKGILKDRELMRAIDRQDLERLATDPKIQSLMRNKTLGKLLEKAQ
ncbi:MAG: hypothetical protein ACE5G9_01845 [Nitrospinales bacterium]